MQLIRGTDYNSGMRRIAQLPEGYLWFLLPVILLAASIALAQSPEQKAALTEARRMSHEAIALSRAGNFSQVEALIERSLAIREKVLGPDHPAVATSLNDLGSLYRSTEEYDKAEPLLERAVAIWEKALGPDDPGFGTGLHDLALFYESRAEHAKAEPLYDRALAIWEKALGPDHAFIATGLNNLADLYRATERDEEAEALEQRAARIEESL